MDNGTMVEVFKYLNYCGLAKNSLVSKRFRNLIQTHRHSFALLDVYSLGMRRRRRLRGSDPAGIKMFGKDISSDEYNEWVTRNQYSKQISLKGQDAATESTQDDRIVYALDVVPNFQEGLAANTSADYRAQEDEIQEEEFEDFGKYAQNDGENMLESNNFGDDGEEYDNKFSAFAQFGRNGDRSNGSSPPASNLRQNAIKRELSASPGVERTESPMEHMDMADICGTSGNKDVKDRFNSRIIQLVSQHSALYDFNADGYKSNDIRNKEWDDVAATLGQPTDFVRTRWKTLRDRFKKECRKQQMHNIAPRWHHFEEMLFLAPFIRDRPSDFMFNDESGLEFAQSNSTPGYQSASQTCANKSQRRPMPSNGENVNRSESNTNYILGKLLETREPVTKDEKPEYGNKRSRMDQPSVNRSGTFSQNDDEEDVLFCKIMLKKMQRMSEHTKEKAKAKIMELLVQFQYGEVS
ncbi:alcohol dehydrogenase transcription factor myb/SANT-like domain-containing protein [Ditylenchus destructor]|nr:alcohol dehydrogenase transcription factor myb/SANT-like domain-containing protein [Ditylenchus destructor]